jgi:hypothetical protein
VIVDTNNASSSTTATVVVSGVTIQSKTNAPVGGSENIGLFFIVPNGSTYSITYTGGFNKWAELR